MTVALTGKFAQICYVYKKLDVDSTLKRYSLVTDKQYCNVLQDICYLCDELQVRDQVHLWDIFGALDVLFNCA